MDSDETVSASNIWLDEGVQCKMEIEETESASNIWLDEGMQCKLEIEEASARLKGDDDKEWLNENSSSSSENDDTPSNIKAKIFKGQYQVVNKSGRSKIWDIFAIIKNTAGNELKSVVSCKECNSVLKYNKRCTSNLVKHRCYRNLKAITSENQRAAQIDEPTKNNLVCTRASSGNSLNVNIKAKIVSGQYKVVNKSGKSKIWDIYARIKNEDGKEFESVVLCKKCNNVFKFSKQWTSNLVKHICYRNAEAKKSENNPAKQIDVPIKKDIVYASASSSNTSNLSIKSKILNGQYKLVNKIGRSKLWDIYAKIKNEDGKEFENVVSCKMCNSILKFNKKLMSNLVKHMCYRKYPTLQIDDGASKRRIVCANALSSNISIKTKVLNGQYKLVNKNGRSEVWKIYAKIQNEAGKEFESSVFCKKCKNVFKFTKKCTSNLVKHMCYRNYIALRNLNHNGVQVTEATKEKMVCILTEWAIENCHSLKIIENSGLNKLANYLISVGARYGDNINLEHLLPHPTTLTTNLTEIYEKSFNDVKAELNGVTQNGYGITTDMWTDSYLKSSYLAVNIHYVKEGELKTRFLGLKCMDGEESSGENIKLQVSQILADFDCELSDKTIVVTNGDAKMVSAFHLYNHIHCTNHLLNNAVEKSINETTEIAELTNECSKLVEYFKTIAINSKLEATLNSFTPTRWNTIFYLLSSVENNWVDIKNILQERNEMQRIKNINLSYIQATVKLLSSFEKTSKQLESELNATLHWVYIDVHNLKKMCNAYEDDLSVIKILKEKLSYYLDEMVITNLNLHHKISLFLFPPTKILKQLTESDKKFVKTECKNLMRDYIIKTEKEEHDDIPSTSNASINISIYSERLSDFLESTTLNTDDEIDNEISAYENRKVEFTDDFNVLHWWNSHKTDLPLLYKVSCKLLATPASSAASERIFSMARNLISAERSVIGTNYVTVNQMLFLHCQSKISDEIKVE